MLLLCASLSFSLMGLQAMPRNKSFVHCFKSIRVQNALLIYLSSKI